MKILTLLALSTLALAGCSSDADTASRNISRAAEQFEINRRVVFYNGITDSYILSIEGRCSVERNVQKRLDEVTCKVGPNAFKKHYLAHADNVTFFAEQLEPVDVGTFHYRVIFKPQSILPDMDFRTNAEELAR